MGLDQQGARAASVWCHLALRLPISNEVAPGGWNRAHRGVLGDGDRGSRPFPLRCNSSVEGEISGKSALRQGILSNRTGTGVGIV